VIKSSLKKRKSLSADMEKVKEKEEPKIIRKKY